MTSPIRFFVPGEPKPQGSHRAYVVSGRAKITDDNPGTRPWRSCVLLFASQAMAGGPALFGPVALTVQFLMPRPRGHFGSGKNAGRLVPSAPIFPRVKPDLDKMVRAVCDALKGVCWRDDAQVCSVLSRKDYASRGVQVGAIIQVELLTPDVAPHS